MSLGKVIDALSVPITHPVATFALTSLASVAGGVYLGYCSAKGTDANLENVLKYGPAVAQGTFGFLSTGLFVSLLYTSSNSDYKRAAGIGTFATIGGAMSAGMGALETFVGYSIGYTLGHMGAN
ncbi:hypothetical protein HY837_00660 [archaeon]|nr:hypothetical protein [archaeon]